MMKKCNATKRQAGFFDLGISLLVLAIGGAVALSANHAQEKRAAVQQDNAAMVMNQQPAAAMISAEALNPNEKLQ